MGKLAQLVDLVKMKKELSDELRVRVGQVVNSGPLDDVDVDLLHNLHEQNKAICKNIKNAGLQALFEVPDPWFHRTFFLRYGTEFRQPLVNDDPVALDQLLDGLSLFFSLLEEKYGM